MKRKAFAIATACLYADLLLLPVAAVLAAGGRLVYPWGYLPILLAALAAVAALGRRCGSGGRILLPLLALCGTLLWGCAAFGLGVRGVEYSSPNGENTVIVEYDFGGRPRLFRKYNWLLRSKIPLGRQPGFMETVTYQVLWETEDRLVLELGVYKGVYEACVVDLPTGGTEWIRIPWEEHENGRTGK